jgi:hypothetical protein
VQRIKVTGDLFHGKVPDGAVYVGRAAPRLHKSRSLFSLMTPNASELAPMIPAMEHRFARVLTRVLAVVAGVGLALWMALGLFSFLINAFPVSD